MTLCNLHLYCILQEEYKVKLLINSFLTMQIPFPVRNDKRPLKSNINQHSPSNQPKITKKCINRTCRVVLSFVIEFFLFCKSFVFSQKKKWVEHVALMQPKRVYYKKNVN